jgi:signal transduction histidine kinase
MRTALRFPRFCLAALLLPLLLAPSCQDAPLREVSAADPLDLYQHYVSKFGYNLNVAYQYDLAMSYADSMLLLLRPYATHTAYNLQYAEAHLYKGDVLFRLKRYNEACFYFYQGQKSILPTVDSCTFFTFLAHFNGKLANVSYQQGRFPESADFNKKSFNYLRLCGNGFEHFYSLQALLDNIALCYNETGLPDSSLYYYQQALQLIDSSGPTYLPEHRVAIDVAKGVIYGNQGTSYLKKGELALAERQFTKSIALNSQKGFAEQDAMITRVKLAELYIQAKRLPEAKTLIQQIEAATATDTLPRNAQTRLLQARAAYAAAEGQMDKAYQYLQLSTLQRNEADAALKKLMGTDFLLELNLLNHRYELDTLKKQDQMKNIYLLAALVLFLLTIAILYLTLKSRQQARAHAQQSLRHNQQLELMLDALEKSNHEYAQLLRVVAHDLKNPLSVIYMIVELMTVQEGHPPEDLEMLQLIRGASVNMNTVIQDLLSAKNIHENSTIRKEQVDIQLLLRQSVDLLKYRAVKKQQKIVLASHPTCLVQVNYEQIWRVINNLVVNAIKFSPAHSTIRVNWEENDDRIIIQVADEGIGIPDHLKEEIFQPFSEAKRTGTAGEEPFGMGLYISRQIIEQHGGSIWLESSPGKGTIFYISLQIH